MALPGAVEGPDSRRVVGRSMPGRIESRPIVDALEMVASRGPPGGFVAHPGGAAGTPAGTSGD